MLSISVKPKCRLAKDGRLLVQRKRPLVNLEDNLAGQEQGWAGDTVGAEEAGVPLLLRTKKGKSSAGTLQDHLPCSL